MVNSGSRRGEETGGGDVPRLSAALTQGQAGRTAIDNTADRGAVALAKAGDREQFANGITRHGKNCNRSVFIRPTDLTLPTDQAVELFFIHRRGFDLHRRDIQLHGIDIQLYRRNAGENAGRRGDSGILGQRQPPDGETAGEHDRQGDYPGEDRTVDEEFGEHG